MPKDLLLIVLALTIWLVSVDFAAAHHVLGRPAYSLNEDSNTPPSMQAEVQVGDYMVTYMVFPAFPQPGKPGRISLYVSRLDDGTSYDGTVTFMVREAGWRTWITGAKEGKIGSQRIDDAVYRQAFQFHNAGEYTLSARFQDKDEPYIIDFPLLIGDIGSSTPIYISVGLVLLFLVGINLTQRRRTRTGKIKGMREEADKP